MFVFDFYSLCVLVCTQAAATDDDDASAELPAGWEKHEGR